MTDITQWTAPVGCVEHYRGILERHVNAQPPHWCQEPAVGEVFDNRKDAEVRLQLWALIAGFDVVCKGGGSSKVPGGLYRCIHHGKESRNDHGLEDRVTRNPKGKITSLRKRESTKVYPTNCDWRVNLAFIMIDKKDESQGRQWTFTKVSLTHTGHPLTANPFAAYLNHRKRLAEWKDLIAKATAHRRAKVVYSSSRRIIESEEFALHLSVKEYYNTMRKKPVDKDNDKSIIGLVHEIQESNWHCEFRSEVYEDEEGKVVGRKLIQVWFTHPKLMSYTKRFVSDFIIYIDGTFNTNKLKMPLLIAVGQLNSGKTFPVAFSWCPEEDEASYTFFLAVPQGLLF
ncbi:uncharacterized protein A1O9_13138 [Exophiala aquamarina CBS 119918]|uniref:MULE transposase domain-containing protein n=1 Tax=Exophiala aquamarina CBS 119918 TaxID=1182545 RepID=A0A072NUX0_9EURO|nr:uncharacterized protein A1O9_13138 [Exophiala aquamarina CBS 119918]KEF50808.1 hypothetical protein A1O9_13138 [Exophiala aquamarina CBS 119918]